MFLLSLRKIDKNMIDPKYTEEIDGKIQVLSDDVTDVTQQLIDTENQFTKRVNRETIPQYRGQKAIATFIDDDGRVEFLTKWLPIIEEFGITVCIAVVTSWVENGNPIAMTWEQLHNLHKNYGVQMLNHTHTHPELGKITDALVISEFEQSTGILRREGFTHDIMVYPYGSSSEFVRNASRNYFRASVGTTEGANVPPIITYGIRRITLGEAMYTSWEQYKEIIDKAIANKEWIVFKSHSQYTSFDANQIALIKQIIGYLNANNVPITGVHEALDTYGNIMDVGDYTGRTLGRDYTIMDCNGVMHSKSNALQYRYLGVEKQRAATAPITDFEKSVTTVDAIQGGYSAGYPSNSAGTLTTHRGVTDTWSYQTFQSVSNNSLFKRRWDTANSKWLDFTEVGAAGGGMSVLLTTNITDIMTSGLYYAGVASIDKPTAANCFVTAHVYGAQNKAFMATIPATGDSYLATYTSGALSPWKKVEAGTIRMRQLMSLVKVPGNGEIDVDVTVTGATPARAYAFNLDGSIPSGIIYNINCKANNLVTIRFRNFTESEVTVPAVYLNTTFL